MPTCSWSALSSTLSDRRSLASSAPSGSSSSSTAGCRTSALASATRCCWPPDSWPGLRFSNDLSLTRSSAAPTRLDSSALGSFLLRSPKATLSKTFRNGNSA